MCCVLSLCAASNLCNECVLSAQRRYVSVSSLVGLDRPSLRLPAHLSRQLDGELKVPVHVGLHRLALAFVLGPLHLTMVMMMMVLMMVVLLMVMIMMIIMIFRC